MTNEDVYFDSIILDMKALNQKQLYKKISKHVSSLIGTPEQDLLDILMTNEEKQNSGIGKGVAIASARLPRLTRSMVVFVKMSTSVNFEAADGEPVDLMALVLSPEFEDSKYLQRLAALARLLQEEETLSALRSAKDFDSVRMAITDTTKRKKAA